MGNKLSHRYVICLILLALCLFTAHEVSMAQDEQPVQPPTIVFAPQGTPVSASTAKEQYRLGREYQYDVKQKEIITSPYLAAPGEGPAAAPEETEALNEQERLYRYFGIATELYKAGRAEEALELLRYVASKRPNDQYLQNYLRDMEKKAEINKAKWKKSYEKDADILKVIKIKNLTEEGVAYYHQKNYDKALVRFSDVLTLDPDNGLAKGYIEKLKKHYMKEIKIDNIVEDWMLEVDKEKTPSAENAIDELLTRAELKEKGIAPDVQKTAENLLNKEETRQLVMDKKASLFLNEAQYDTEVKDVIDKWREEEKKASAFTLGPGDQLMISVRDHPELSGKVTVGRNGTIILPLTNDAVKVGGMILEEVNEEVVNVMKRYVKEPLVNASIIAYNSKVFYVIDEFGAYPYSITRPDFTLRDALFTADWGENRALGRVIVMKPDKFNPIVKKVDAFDIIYRGKLANNIRIENGDVIYIPMTAASKITQVIKDTLEPFKQFKQARDEWIDLKWNQSGYKNLGRWPENAARQADWEAGAAGVEGGGV